jgi:hypothetical protein
MKSKGATLFSATTFTLPDIERLSGAMNFKISLSRSGYRNPNVPWMHNFRVATIIQIQDKWQIGSTQL